ncbi:hypothetical protein LOZ12_002330 [Ophidiomyces ophidiicola]|uniref:Uncharacterized protein n=1 Tax=Ophidiomyces ophidiicola TaxID=1387563 RepID=A0ACB8UN05_9EURO|nr:uncharacterized protein LOZ57_003939 [Ophidiomyces ophidiicola]KAI1912310.1 hypothetical protein LOZ61_003315 [Ophidiomyces ophidiicola]KAI1920319.1 hypothetical protein LOZ64_001946 [Ophidiomyces ophidiicola]KAI1922804.1 hypothetical protein LOZ60_005519 [Ophidiomyces ophidiicola]KAI1935190.1 hypothetical protein LOZ62_006043 [Ophidiomyces ophidiicola]KAI1946187.1 hypothetical protein LOZ57_003939 [Ophidiomyces ophidiicola]
MRRYPAPKRIHLGRTSVRYYYPSPVLSEGKRDPHSIHINSEKLCDDLLKRLAPSFQNSSPIDIVDLYPGTGLWSRKVHDFLKPRRHIFLEPCLQDYKPYLQPLVKSGSTYKLLPWDPLDVASLAKLFSKGHLPEQTRRELGPQGACQLNPSLLVLANLTRHRQNYSNRFSLFLRFLEAYFNQTILHQYGLVRIIMIFGPKDAAMVLPRTVFGRRRLSVIADAAGADIIQLTGDTLESNQAAIKGQGLWEECSKAVAARASHAGVSTPRRRAVAPLELAPIPLTMIAAKEIKYFPRPKHDWHDKYLEFVKEYEKHLKRDPTARSLPDPERSQRFLLYRKRLLLENRQMPLVKEASEILLAIDKIQIELRALMRSGRPYPPRTTTLVSEMASLTSKYQDACKQLTPLHKSHAVQRFQETHAFHTSNVSPTTGDRTPLLCWDRRPFEPLRVRPQEFKPPVVCSIVDFRPNPSSFMLRELATIGASNQPRDTYHNLLVAFHHVVRIISRGAAKAADKALLRPLFPGRSMAELVAAVPSLEVFAKVSARYNGAETLENLTLEYGEDCLADTTLRILPVHVLWDIALEWNKWPLRPVEAPDLWKLLGGKPIDQIEATFKRKL